MGVLQTARKGRKTTCVGIQGSFMCEKKPYKMHQGKGIGVLNGKGYLTT
jgi:hypothetical protein